MLESWDLAFFVEPDLPYTESLLDRLVPMGISYIGPNCFTDWRSDVAVEQFRRLWQRSGLKVWNYHSPVGLIFADPASGRENKALADGRRQIDITAAWGAKSVVFHHNSFRDYPQGRDTYWLASNDIAAVQNKYGIKECNRRFAEMLSNLSGYASKFEITVCVENIILPPPPGEGAEILALLEQAGGSHLGYCLDTCHAHASGVDVGTEIRRAKKWLKDTHFSDCLGPRGWPGTRISVAGDYNCRDPHMVVGLGTIDWFDVCTALREINYSNPIYFEGPNIPGIERIAETETQAIEMTVKNWRAIEYASLHLPPIPDE